MPFTIMFPGCWIIRKNRYCLITRKDCWIIRWCFFSLWIQQDLRTFWFVLSICFGTAFFVLQTSAAVTFAIRFRFSHSFYCWPGKRNGTYWSVADPQYGGERCRRSKTEKCDCHDSNPDNECPGCNSRLVSIQTNTRTANGYKLAIHVWSIDNLKISPRIIKKRLKKRLEIQCQNVPKMFCNTDRIILVLSHIWRSSYRFMCSLAS